MLLVLILLALLGDGQTLFESKRSPLMTNAPQLRPEMTDQRGPRSTSAEMARRLELLEAEWINGATPSQLRRFARDQWGISDRQARRLVQQLREQARADWDETDKAETMAELLSRLSAVYARALERNNLPTALGALNTAARVSGLIDGQGVTRQAVAGAMAEVLQVIGEAGWLSPDQRVDLRLRLAAKGLAPMPSLETLPDEQLRAIAEGGMAAGG